MSEAILDRAAGALLGRAIGDAVGTTLEFSTGDSTPPLTDMVGCGPFALARRHGDGDGARRQSGGASRL